MRSPEPTNRLSTETSPYLLQHAHNPVDWYPWGPDAFRRARSLDRPVFLSVGYAACHWCHVMERESFEDEETAALLNERFVSIKVDREERPDVDAVYMDAVQAMTGQGGWPMSVWLTPDGRPFYAGTYFPKATSHRMPSFRRVLEAVAEAWSTQRDEIEALAGTVTEGLGRTGEPATSPHPINQVGMSVALPYLRREFDHRWGGFGGAPKFPQPMVLEFLLRITLHDTPDALDMVRVTLDRMAEGGIHDQVGGGFARYSTDAAWHVPHFEKMLYDNAQLARVYTQAWLVTRDDRYQWVAASTLDYLLREMQLAEGGFAASQDADSEGAEGKFFVWRWDELVELVGEPVAEALGATRSGNWEGTNVLWRPLPLAEVAASHGMTAKNLAQSVEDARALLLDARASRVRPGTDDKVVTAWNALAVRALVEAGRSFHEPLYVEAALRCGIFLWEQVRDDSGRLLRSWRDGAKGRPGFADDHALLAGAYLTLYETTGDVAWFIRAREIADALIELFADTEHGGFFQTGRDAERLVVRRKDLEDNAVPSGNSAAAESLLRLAMLTGENSYEEAAERALRLVRDVAARVPMGFGLALCAMDLSIGPSREIAVIGRPDDPSTRALIDEVVRKRFLPNTVLAVAEPTDQIAAETVPLLAGRTQGDAGAIAYVCERFACRMPVSDPEALARQL